MGGSRRAMMPMTTATAIRSNGALEGEITRKFLKRLCGPSARLVLFKQCRTLRAVRVGAYEDHLPLHGEDKFISRAFPDEQPLEVARIVLTVDRVGVVD